MRNLKIIIILGFITAFAVALVQCTKNEFSPKENGSSGIELRGSNPCVPNLSLLNCTNEFYPMSVSLPGYPGCTFEVGVTRYKCTDEQIIVYHLEDYYIIYHNCPQYNTDVQNAIQNGTINDFYIQFGQQMWDAITQKLLLNTPSTYTVASMYYYIASCSKYCTYEIVRDGSKALVMRKLNCGKNCCSLFQRFQLINSKWEPVERRINTSAEPCFGIRPPECPGGTIHSIDCFPQCDVFNF